jgi:simple sugar transport system ATP-binding protein
MAARNRGAAVLLVSEDLDELLELSDRILVMSEGRIVYETRIESADTRTFFLHGRTSLRRQPSPRPFPFALDLRSAALIVIDMTLSSRGASAMSDQLPGDFIKPFSSLKNRGSHTISRALIAKPPRLPSEPQTNVLRLCSPRRRSSGRAGITCGATHADTALCNVGAWRSAQGVMSGELLRSIVVAPSRFCSKRRPVALER